MANTLDSLKINTPSGAYPIYFGSDYLADLQGYLKPYIKGHKIFIVTDKQVAELYLDHVEKACGAMGVKVISFILEAGESTKAFQVFERVSTDMLRAEPDRRTTLLALGGGVVGDLTGFIASVLLRGVPFIQIPTTLLAQVDSSVGGKTAINCKAGKNLIGSFYQPDAVFMDLATLKSLPKRELLAGYAEIIKYGLLGDKAFYDTLLQCGERVVGGDAKLQQQMVKYCCKMKADIVSQDEKEQGKRALLNLGHTFGHAIEKQAGYDGSVLHGEAVALGCVMAMALAVKAGKVSESDKDALITHFKKIGLPTKFADLQGNHIWDAATLTKHCYQDKKAEGGALTFITLDAIGKAVVSRDINAADITAIFTEFGG